MSSVSALQDARFDGAVTVEEAGLQGMVTLKADLSAQSVVDGLKRIGLNIPGQRQIVETDTGAIAWMAPDELLFLCDHDKAGDVEAQLDAALQGQHVLIVNISDARAMFRIEGKGVREVLAKLAPVDLHPDSFGPGEIRRTRLAQVPAAFWMQDDDAFNVICFRSVARYVFDILFKASETSYLRQAKQGVL